MRRLGAVTAAVAVVLALTAGTALANPPTVTGTLDQNQHDISANSATWDFHFALAQTFTPAVTGTLNAVGVYIGVTSPQAPQPGPNVVVPAATGDTVIGVWNVTGGVPSGSPLVTTFVNVVDQAPGWRYFEFSSPPSVVSGTPYAITVAGGGENATDNPDFLNWYGDCGENYVPGQALVFDDSLAVPVWHTVPIWQFNQGADAAVVCHHDFAFETYMTAAPISTAPPTSTDASAAGTTGGGSPAIPVMFACFAAAAAFVTIRRYGLARR